MSTLNRWVDQRKAMDSGLLGGGRASGVPSECRSIKEAEGARSQNIRQLTTLISQIQNAALGEQRIRDMNDEINRCIRSKYAWETQIRKLGGPDYSSIGIRVGESEGIELPGQGGYRYFGAARDLPGVRDMLEREPAMEGTHRSRKQLLEHIKADYYGWMDDQDIDMAISEAEADIGGGEQLTASDRLRRAGENLGFPDGSGSQVGHGGDFTLTSTGMMDTLLLESQMLEMKKTMLIKQYLVCTAFHEMYSFL